MSFCLEELVTIAQVLWFGVRLSFGATRSLRDTGPLSSLPQMVAPQVDCCKIAISLIDPLGPCPWLSPGQIVQPYPKHFLRFSSEEIVGRTPSKLLCGTLSGSLGRTHWRRPGESLSGTLGRQPRVGGQHGELFGPHQCSVRSVLRGENRRLGIGRLARPLNPWPSAW